MEAEYLIDFGHLGLVALAILLGAIIGLERELQGKPAGLRTHMLVCASACLFTLLGKIIIQEFGEVIPEDDMASDPTRVIQAIAVGVSFIGAGTIIQVEQKQRVRYLTTAASVLFIAAIGVAIALEEYILGIGSTVLAFIVNSGVGKIEHKFIGHEEDEAPEKSDESQ